MLYLIIAEIGFAIPKLTRVREYLNFGLPLVPGSIANWIVNSSDRYLLALFLGYRSRGLLRAGIHCRDYYQRDLGTISDAASCGSSKTLR